MGDYCTDIFLYGFCNRISPEAPVPVFLFDHEIRTDGMAGNVYNNLKSLNVNTDLLVSTKDIQKIRYIDLKSKQHLIRADFEKPAPELIINFETLKQYDAIIISDYNKGSITEKVYSLTRQLYDGLIFVDSKKNNLSIFDHENTILKINDLEFTKANKLPLKSPLIVTKGDKGAMYNGKIYSTKKVEVFDVSGAGDSFMCGLVVQYLLTRNMPEAINFANVCASNVVKKTGTAIIDFQEVMHDIRF